MVEANYRHLLDDHFCSAFQHESIKQSQIKTGLLVSVPNHLI